MLSVEKLTFDIHALVFVITSKRFSRIYDGAVGVQCLESSILWSEARGAVRLPPNRPAPAEQSGSHRTVRFPPNRPAPTEPSGSHRTVRQRRRPAPTEPSGRGAVLLVTGDCAAPPLCGLASALDVAPMVICRASAASSAVWTVP